MHVGCPFPSINEALLCITCGRGAQNAGRGAVRSASHPAACRPSRSPRLRGTMWAVSGCDQCGFEYDSVPIDEIGSALRSNAQALVDTLSAEDLRSRPEPDVWSPLEYACHVRDVMQIQVGRVARGLAEETPSFRPMEREERPARLRYNEQDPVVVREQVLDAAGALADVFDGLSEEQLARTVTYNWPVEMIRPLRWVGRHTVHELVHHRLDIERALRNTRE